MQQQSKTTMAKEEIKETISDTQKSMNDIKEKLAEINNYDRSKLDKQIYELEKQNNPKNEFQINKLKYYKEYNLEKKNLSPKGMVKLFGIFNTFSTVYIIFMIILLSDIVSGEYSPNTIKSLITKPISRKKNYNIKVYSFNDFKLCRHGYKHDNIYFRNWNFTRFFRLQISL